MALPDIKLDVTRRIDGEQGNVWLPVGSIALWRRDDGTYSGKLRLNLLGEDELHVFEQTEKSQPASGRSRKAYRGEPTEEQDDFKGKF